VGGETDSFAVNFSFVLSRKTTFELVLSLSVQKASFGYFRQRDRKHNNIEQRNERAGEKNVNLTRFFSQHVYQSHTEKQLEVYSV
jgi:hypothetical protein